MDELTRKRIQDRIEYLKGLYKIYQYAAPISSYGYQKKIDALEWVLAGSPEGEW